MSAYSVDNIIPVSTTISTAGLGYANFASAFLFAPETELPAGLSLDTPYTYSTLNEMASAGWSETDETYLAATRWLGGIPATNSLTVWVKDDTNDTSITASLNKARETNWWFWSFFTKDIYASEADVLLVAAWCEANESMFRNTQTGAAATEIRTGVADNISQQLTTLGYRYSSTSCHATDPYAGIATCKWLAGVNYSAANSTLDTEYKKLSGVAAESLGTTAYTNMKAEDTKCEFYTVVDLQGSIDNGRVINSWSHSAFGEYFDDVVNTAAFINRLKTDVYNATAGQPKKLAQTPRGQAVINAAARTTCQLYVTNNFLGERNYTDPDTGEENKYTPGFEILTDPDEILDLSDADRAARKSAVLRIRIFRAGAIRTAPIDLTVY